MMKHRHLIIILISMIVVCNLFLLNKDIQHKVEATSIEKEITEEEKHQKNLEFIKTVKIIGIAYLIFSIGATIFVVKFCCRDDED